MKNRLLSPNFHGKMAHMKSRKSEVKQVLDLLKRNSIVGIIGARQVGKSTLARQIADVFAGKTTFFDLEDDADVARLADPLLALRPLRGLVVLDEIQRRPELFPSLRVLADRSNSPCRFLVLGSAAPELLRQSSETLAGRIAYHQLSGFSMADTDASMIDSLWLRGGFPRAFLAEDDAASFFWRRDFVRTYLERDLASFGLRVSATTLRRFWAMLAHYHAQTWNASEFARAFGVADTTIRNYLDILTSALLIRQLQPWHANIAKRQVKAPKVYVLDSGLLHALLNLPAWEDLLNHPKIGASWEGFIINEIISHLHVDPEECFFWATHTGAELDLLIIRGKHRMGFEIKRTSSPSVTPSMRSALNDLQLTSLNVIHAGDKTFLLHERIRAIAASQMLQVMRGFPH
jgi:predicted AAA+ superfamily ATPase